MAPSQVITWSSVDSRSLPSIPMQFQRKCAGHVAIIIRNWFCPSSSGQWVKWKLPWLSAPVMLPSPVIRGLYAWLPRFTSTKSIFFPYQAALYRLWAYGFVHQAYSHFPTWIIINTLRPRQNDRHFPDKIFKHNILNENVGISVQISLKFISLGSIIQHWFR